MAREALADVLGRQLPVRSRPLEQTRMGVPGARRSPWAATSAGRSRAGTAKITRSRPARSSVPARATVRDGATGTPGRYWRFSPSRAMASTCASPRQPSAVSMPPRSRETASPVPHDPAPSTVALRTGAMPPSHSHCSCTQGQMRSVTAWASGRDGSSTVGKRNARPARTRTLCGRTRSPRRMFSVPMTATGRTGAPVSSARRPTPRRAGPSGPGRTRVPSGKMTTQSPRSRIARAVSMAPLSPVPRATGKAPSELMNQRSGFVNSSCLATKYSGRRASVRG